MTVWQSSGFFVGDFRLLQVRHPDDARMTMIVVGRKSRDTKGGLGKMRAVVTSLFEVL